MKRFAQLLTRRPVWVLAAAALATLVALHGIVDLRTGAPRLRIDPSAERLLPEGDEDRRFYDRARQLFGNDEFVLLMVEADDVFTTDVLDRVARITGAVSALPGVRRVVSLASAVDVRG